MRMTAKKRRPTGSESNQKCTTDVESKRNRMKNKQTQINISEQFYLYFQPAQEAVKMKLLEMGLMQIQVSCVSQSNRLLIIT